MGFWKKIDIKLKEMGESFRRWRAEAPQRNAKRRSERMLNMRYKMEEAKLKSELFDVQSGLETKKLDLEEKKSRVMETKMQSMQAMQNGLNQASKGIGGNSNNQNQPYQYQQPQYQPTQMTNMPDPFGEKKSDKERQKEIDRFKEMQDVDPFAIGAESKEESFKYIKNDKSKRENATEEIRKKQKAMQEVDPFNIGAEDTDKEKKGKRDMFEKD